MKNINFKSGYSIIEIIIYVAVFAIISIIVANAFIVLVSFFNQSRTNHDLLQNGNTALERMSHEIRIASAVKGTSVLNTSPGSLELDSLDENGNPQVIKFSLTNGALNIYKDGTLIGNMLGPNINATSLIFRNVSTPNSKVVKIEMTLKDTRDKTGYSEKFDNIVVLPKEETESSGSENGSTSKINLVYDGIHSGTDGFNFQRQMTYVGNIYSAGLFEQQQSGSDVIVNGSIYSSFSANGWPDIKGGYSFPRLVVNGDTYGDMVYYTQANGNLYCKSGYSNNKACDTSKPNTVVTPIPDWSANITDWKAKAAAGGECVISNYDSYVPLTLGPCKVSNYLTLHDNLTLTGPLWVTGYLRIIGGGKIVKPDSSYGANDEVIITDSSMLVGNSTVGGTPTYFQGSGTGDSNILMVSLAWGYNAIQLSNLEGNVLFYAPNGVIVATNKNKNKSMIAQGVSFSGTPGTVDIIEHISGTTTLDIGKGLFSVTP